MNIIWEKIVFKNFMSYGDTETTFYFNKSPSTLITGKNGSGKCVRKNTKINIKFNTTLSEKLYLKLFKYLFCNENYQTTVGEIEKLYSTYPEIIGDILVHTRNGYKTIEYADITAKDSEVLKIIINDKMFIECSPNHLLMGTDWIYANKLKVGDKILTENGFLPILSIEKLVNKEDLYDLQVEGQEYIANGIVSHNSSIVEAFVFGIKGNTYRGSNKQDLINTINKKDCLVKLYFTKGNSKYEIHRGMKPNVFYIVKDGKKIEESASIRDMQQYLENHILQTPINGIIKTSILGCDYKPFMMMSSKEKRELIEYILEINVFTDMNKYLKTIMSTFKDNFTELQSKIQVEESVLNVKKEMLDNIKNKNIKDNNKDKEELKELKKKLTILKENIDNYNNDLLNLVYDKDIISIQEEVETYNNQLNNIKFEIDSKKRLIQKLKEIDGHCNECGQSVSNEHKEEHILKYESEIKDIGMTGKEIFNKRKEKLEDINEYQKYIEKQKEIKVLINTLISQYDNYNEIFQKKTKEYKEKIKAESLDINHYIDDYNNKVNEINQLKEQEKEYLYQRQIHNLSAQLLKDDGIKAYIVDQYIPILNHSVNYYLKCLNSPLVFNIDKNLDVRLDLRYPGEFNYYTLSMGERQRIDLSMSFAWRKLASIKNSINTNLLILDETFDASIDMDGVDDLLIILDDLRKNGVNVFVISHKGGLEDKLRSTVRVEKQNQFSRFVFNKKD